MNFKIENKTIDGGKWYKKYFWYIYVQLRYWIWNFFKNPGEIVFFEDNTVKNFNIKKWEITVFWLPRYIYVTLKIQGKKKELGDFYVEEMK